MTNLVHTYDTSRYTANTKMYSGILPYLPYEDRLCTKCLSADIGDEFHYVSRCPFYAETRRKKKKKKIFHHFVAKMQMLIDFTVFFAVKRNDYW